MTVTQVNVALLGLTVVGCAVFCFFTGRLVGTLKNADLVDRSILEGLSLLAFSGDTPNAEVRPALRFLLSRRYAHVGSKEATRWGDLALATVVISVVLGIIWITRFLP